MYRILLVEDEEQIRKIVKLNLELDNYEVITAENGKIALELINGQHFDLLLLDIMLPEINGLQICEQVRLINKNVGIIFISAKDGPNNRIEGLKMGADDYLSKPFNLEELLLRVKNVIRRSNEQEKSALEYFEFGSNSINFKTYEAVGNKGKFRLTRKEVLLLKMLMERADEVVSRKQILQNVWGYDVYPSTRTIDNFILNFRKYFESDARNPVYFHSVRGVGYKFNSPK